VIKIKFIFEVESRFHFKTEKEIYEQLPFVKDSIKYNIKWKTVHYGIDLFEKDIILRLSYNELPDNSITVLGYKEADMGNKINIRKEYSEIIDHNFEESKIIDKLGGEKKLENLEEIKSEFKKLGHDKFMAFEGKSKLGFCEKLKLDLKIMYCKQLRYPLILEIEKEAENIEDAEQKSKEIMKFIDSYSLKNRLITKEPPTLLYEALNMNY